MNHFKMPIDNENTINNLLSELIGLKSNEKKVMLIATLMVQPYLMLTIVGIKKHQLTSNLLVAHQKDLRANSNMA